MMLFTQRQIRFLVDVGAAVDVTKADDVRIIPEPYRQIGYSAVVNGCNGRLLLGEETATLYAVTARTSALFIFG